MNPSNFDSELKIAIRESHADPTDPGKASRLLTLMVRTNTLNFDLLGEEQKSALFNYASPRLSEIEFAARLKLLHHLDVVPSPDGSPAMYKEVPSWPELWIRIFRWRGANFEQSRFQDVLVSKAVTGYVRESLNAVSSSIKDDLQDALDAITEFYVTGCTSNKVYWTFIKLQSAWGDDLANESANLLKACLRLTLLPILQDPFQSRDGHVSFTGDIYLDFEGRTIGISDSGMTDLSGETLMRGEAQEFLLKEILTLVSHTTGNDPSSIYKELLSFIVPWLCDDSHRFALNDEEREFNKGLRKVDDEFGLESENYDGA